MDDSVSALPIGDVLAGLAIPPLPDDAPAKAAFVLAMHEDSDGDDAWVARVTLGVNSDELLGVLVGYVEHLKQESAANWSEGYVTAPDDAGPNN
jgi:hypothetical protein